MKSQCNLVVGIGEALWDLLPTGKKVGGAPANFAYHASQLGLESYAVSALGNDNLGDELASEFEKVSLKTVMPRLDFPTGTVNVTLDQEGVPSYEICEGVAWDNIPFTKELEELAKKTTAVCFGSLAQRNYVSRATIQRFLELMPESEKTLKIFDINLRQSFYSKDIIESSLRICNILKINDDELEVVGDLFGYSETDQKTICLKLLEEYDLDIVVLTCGAKQSMVYTIDDESIIPTPKVKVADTVGAGDSFTGAFTAAILNGNNIHEAHQLAVQISAYVCTKAGAMPAIPQTLL